LPLMPSFSPGIGSLSTTFNYLENFLPFLLEAKCYHRISVGIQDFCEKPHAKVLYLLHS
jgi:hypothetical protein